MSQRADQNGKLTQSLQSLATDSNRTESIKTDQSVYMATFLPHRSETLRGKSHSGVSVPSGSPEESSAAD